MPGIVAHLAGSDPWGLTPGALRGLPHGSDPAGGLRSRDGRARRRRASGRGHTRTAPANAAPLLEHARAECVPQGGAPPEDGLLQAARRADEARFAHAGGEGARSHRDLGRQPRAGGGLGGGAGRNRRAPRHVARRERGKGRGDARLRSRRRPRGGRAARGVRAARRPAGRDRAHARSSLRRPADDRGPGHGRARDPRGPARRGDDRRAGRWRRAHLGRRRRRRRTRARDRGRARAVHGAALRTRGRRASRGDADLDRRRPERAPRGTGSRSRSHRSTSRRSCS